MSLTASIPASAFPDQVSNVIEPADFDNAVAVTQQIISVLSQDILRITAFSVFLLGPGQFGIVLVPAPPPHNQSTASFRSTQNAYIRSAIRNVQLRCGDIAARVETIFPICGCPRVDVSAVPTAYAMRSFGLEMYTSTTMSQIRQMDSHDQPLTLPAVHVPVGAPAAVTNALLRMISLQYPDTAIFQEPSGALRVVTRLPENHTRTLVITSQYNTYVEKVVRTLDYAGYLIPAITWHISETSGEYNRNNADFDAYPQWRRHAYFDFRYRRDLALWLLCEDHTLVYHRLRDEGTLAESLDYFQGSYEDMPDTPQTTFTVASDSERVLRERGWPAELVTRLLTMRRPVNGTVEQLSVGPDDQQPETSQLDANMADVAAVHITTTSLTAVALQRLRQLPSYMYKIRCRGISLLPVLRVCDEPGRPLTFSLLYTLLPLVQCGDNAFRVVSASVFSLDWLSLHDPSANLEPITTVLQSTQVNAIREFLHVCRRFRQLAPDGSYRWTDDPDVRDDLPAFSAMQFHDAEIAYMRRLESELTTVSLSYAIGHLPADSASELIALESMLRTEDLTRTA